LYLALGVRTKRDILGATQSEFMQVLVYELLRTPLPGTWVNKDKKNKDKKKERAGAATPQPYN
jgi:hypothetical protein